MGAVDTRTDDGGAGGSGSAVRRSASDHRPGGWRAITSHFLRRYHRIWTGTAITSFLSPLLYLAGMGYGLGALVDRSTDGIGGVPYVTYIAPGLLAVTALQVAAGETTFAVVGAIKWSRVYEGMLATPLRVVDVVRGHLAYVLLRITMATVIFFVVAAALGTVRSPWGLLAVVLSALGGMAFATCSFAYSASLSNDQGLTLMFRFVVMPMMLFSGTFFPIDQLPTWLQPVAWLTPLWHAVDASRALTLGTATPAGVLGHVGYLLAVTAIGAVLSVRVLRRRMVV
jgi:lipooligosaccharide transport system permease protein